MARKHHLSTGTVREAIRFARAYSRDELEQLCRYRTSREMPLGWNRVRLLMRLKDKQRRAKLERRAAREDWTAERVEAEVQKVAGVTTRVGGGHRGRPFDGPRSLEDGVLQLVERCDAWVKRCAAWGAEGRSLVAFLSTPAAPIDAGQRKGLIDQAREALHRVQRATFDLEERIQKADLSGREPAQSVNEKKRAVPAGPGAVPRKKSRARSMSPKR
jgi:hypothetical protein